MQDKDSYKNGIKAFLNLAACVREVARRSGEDEEEVTEIAKEAFDECLADVEEYSDEYLAIQTQRGIILTDVMLSLVDNHIVEKAMAEQMESEDTCDGNYS